MTPTEPNARAMNAAKLVAELNDIVSYHREMQQAIGSRFGAAWHREHGDTLQEAVTMIQALAERVRAAEHIANSFCANFECDKAKAVDRCPAMVLGERIVAALRPGAPREEGGNS